MTNALYIKSDRVVHLMNELLHDNNNESKCIEQTISIFKTLIPKETHRIQVYHYLLSPNQERWNPMYWVLRRIRNTNPQLLEDKHTQG